MNQRNAMPAKGIRFSARPSAFLRAESPNHEPGSVGSAGTASRISPSPTLNSTAKMTPAMAAARGGARAVPEPVGAALTACLLVVPYASPGGCRRRCGRADLQ